MVFSQQVKPLQGAAPSVGCGTGACYGISFLDTRLPSVPWHVLPPFPLPTANSWKENWGPAKLPCAEMASDWGNKPWPALLALGSGFGEHGKGSATCLGRARCLPTIPLGPITPAGGPWRVAVRGGCRNPDRPEAFLTAPATSAFTFY